jgi:DNA primase
MRHPVGIRCKSILHPGNVQADLGERLGLVGSNERGRYDFFRDRVMLPVLDRQKRPIGFSSRLLDPDAKERKYVNSPDSPLFHKKENLYGLHVAVDAIRRSGTAILVEGNFDVMTLHEAGIEEAVAPMGTALTIEQIKLLARMAKRIVVVFDGDSAGWRAAEKAVPLAVEAGLFFAEADSDGRVAEMPAGLDPDEFVRKEGADAFRALVAQARPMLDHLIQRAADDATIPGKAITAKRVVEVLAKVRNPLVRDLYVRDLAAKLAVPVAQVMRMVRETANHAARNEAAGAESPPAARTRRFFACPRRMSSTPWLCWLRIQSKRRARKRRRFLTFCEIRASEKSMERHSSRYVPGDGRTCQPGSIVGRRTSATK